MPVASRQSAGLLMYRSYTGNLPAFTVAPPGRCRSSAVALPGSVYARWSYGAVPFVAGAVPVVAGAAPVVAGPSR
ncbi:hypothetical protein DPMN_084686 [Dreissena polymorpha]|uniref:Uncharacterized protein n=1 Tax=Dreissena polymorpha TaxID=45954 RepID=A0A9D3YC88_DREPO|nr:hypothetical protein DPMN_084686 [Dreissena polymorpha]